MAANPVAREPVMVAALAAAITWLAAYLGLGLTPAEAAAAAGFVLASVVPFVRQLVRPTAAPPPEPPADPPPK
jgi:hypothetical protein